MTSILLSKQPQIVCDVLNENSKLLVCKKFPKDYTGWVYLYCTKNDLVLYKKDFSKNSIKQIRKLKYHLCEKREINEFGVEEILNSKVFARFWCDKVGEIKKHNAYSLCTEGYHTFVDRFYSDADLQIVSCLNGNELSWYLKGEKDNEIVGYAIHISKLEIFDKPLYLDDFTRPAKCRHCEKCEHKNNKICDKGFVKMFDKPPSNYCYIEGEE